MNVVELPVALKGTHKQYFIWTIRVPVDLILLMGTLTPCFAHHFHLRQYAYTHGGQRRDGETERHGGVEQDQEHGREAVFFYKMFCTILGIRSS